MEPVSTERTYSIGQVSELIGVSAHTLRFYDKEGLFLEPIRRDPANRRLFSEQEIGWLRVGMKLRSTGMPLPDVRRFAALARAGPALSTSACASSASTRPACVVSSPT